MMHRHLSLVILLCSSLVIGIDLDTMLSRSSYQIEGSFGKNRPIHEMISVQALKKTGKIKSCKISLSRWGEEISPYLAGVFWNDDPDFQLFDDVNTGNFNAGLDWSDIFFNCKCRAYHDIKAYVHGPGSRMLCRTHFGDASFLHAQEPLTGISSSVTLNKIKEWIIVMYKLYNGKYTKNTKISSISENRIKEVFGTGKMTFGGLIRVNDIKKAAIGSALHLLEDSYAAGHAMRNKKGDCVNCGSIKMFTAYSVQSGAKHDKYDTFEGIKDSETDLCAKIWTTYSSSNKPIGARQALSSAINLIKAFDKTENDVKQVIGRVFKLDSKVADSGAGQDPSGNSFEGSYSSWRKAVGKAGWVFADGANCRSDYKGIKSSESLNNKYGSYLGTVKVSDFKKRQ